KDERCADEGRDEGEEEVQLAPSTKEQHEGSDAKQGTQSNGRANQDLVYDEELHGRPGQVRRPVSSMATASTDAEVGGPSFFTWTWTAVAGVSARMRSISRSARVSRSL